MEYNDLILEGANSTLLLKAISNEVRVKILELLDRKEMNIQAITQELSLGKTAVLSHINILEKAGFIKTRYVSGTAGKQKICTKVYDRVIYNFSPSKTVRLENECHTVSIPLGNYFDFDVYVPCGFASKSNIISHWDDPEVFLSLMRVKASFLWTAFGFLEYKLPVPPKNIRDSISGINISFEVSPQPNTYEHKLLNLPRGIHSNQIKKDISDISFWINEEKVGMYTTTYREEMKSGILSPPWWDGIKSGELVNIRVDNDNTTVNGKKTSDFGLKDININEIISFKIGICPDAANICGLVLYGKDFGNIRGDIEVVYK